jgi:hypothetical protein
MQKFKIAYFYFLNSYQIFIGRTFTFSTLAKIVDCQLLLLSNASEISSSQLFSWCDGEYLYRIKDMNTLCNSCLAQK